MNKTVFITGGSRGIGAECVKIFSEKSLTHSAPIPRLPPVINTVLAIKISLLCIFYIVAQIR
jgi:hypothetical protein